MRILIAASDKAELAAFDDGYIKIVTGVGPVLAAATVAAAIERFHPDAAISVGTAGSFGSLSIGDVVSFGSVIYRDSDLSAYGLRRGETLSADRRIISSIAMDPSSSLVLATSSAFAECGVAGADGADMEAYGVAVAAVNAGIPCFAVKAITDIVGRKIGMKEYAALRRHVVRLLPSKVAEVINNNLSK